MYPPLLIELAEIDIYLQLSLERGIYSAPSPTPRGLPIDFLPNQVSKSDIYGPWRLALTQFDWFHRCESQSHWLPSDNEQSFTSRSSVCAS
jgi:hypothetical protein